MLPESQPLFRIAEYGLTALWRVSEQLWIDGVPQGRSRDYRQSVPRLMRSQSQDFEKANMVHACWKIGFEISRRKHNNTSQPCLYQTYIDLSSIPNKTHIPG